MNFANPAVLPWLWALLVIPVLYLMRRPARTQPVPHLFLWERVIQQRMPRRRRRLRDMLGLLLQILVAASLLLAWAGPRLESEGRSERPSLIIVDRSLSMSASVAGRSRQAIAVDRAQTLIQSRLLEGPCGLAWAGSSVTLGTPLTRDLVRLEEALQRVPPPAGVIDPQSILRWIEELRRDEAEAVIHLITDRTLDQAGQQELAAAGVVIDSLPVSGSNGGFIDFSLTRAGRGVLSLSCEVAVTGDTAMEGRVILEADNEELAHKAVALEPGSSVRLDFEVPAVSETWLALRWESTDDVFRADDRVDFWAPSSHLLKVLVVSEDLDPFLKNALGALDDVIDVAAAAQTAPSRWRGASGYDLVILSGIDEKRALPPGSYILLDSWAPGLPIKRGRLVGEVQVVRQQKRTTLLRGVDLRDLSVKKAWGVSAGDQVDILLEGTSGPLVSRSLAEDVRFVHVAFDPDPANSSLVLLPAFPLLLKDAAGYLVPKEKRILPVSLPVGGAFVLWETDGGADVMAERPDGTFETLLRRASDGALMTPVRPGRVILHVAGREVPCGLNVCSPELAQVFPRGPAPAQPEVAAPDRTYEYRDVSHLFYLAALLFLLLEWLLWTRVWTR